MLRVRGTTLVHPTWRGVRTGSSSTLVLHFIVCPSREAGTATPVLTDRNSLHKMPVHDLGEAVAYKYNGVCDSHISAP